MMDKQEKIYNEIYKIFATKSEDFCGFWLFTAEYPMTKKDDEYFFNICHSLCMETTFVFENYFAYFNSFKLSKELILNLYSSINIYSRDYSFLRKFLTSLTEEEITYIANIISESEDVPDGLLSYDSCFTNAMGVRFRFTTHPINEYYDETWNPFYYEFQISAFKEGSDGNNVDSIHFHLNSSERERLYEVGKFIECFIGYKFDAEKFWKYLDTAIVYTPPFEFKTWYTWHSDRER